MTHRDELLAMRARLRALEEDFDDVRAENELLRDAQMHRALEVETLRRELRTARREVLPPLPPEEPWLTEVPDVEEEEPASASEAEAPPPVFVTPPVDRRLPATLGVGLLFMGATMIAVMGVLHLASVRRPPPPPPPAPPSHVTPLVRPGHVATSEGFASLRAGDACTVERIPVAVSPFDCRIVVTCNGITLYGVDENSGYVRCEGREWVQDPDITSTDGDPAMIMDVALDMVTVEDDRPDGRWRVRVRL